ncbi:MAG: metallophosphoesterase [Myxococcales bacterium]|nr:metallophosphoesterase [Myxococcales bacterium]
MRIAALDDAPIHALEFLDAAPGGGTKRRSLPFLRGAVEGLPAELDALIVTGDLQGRALPSPGTDADAPLRLVGEAVADELLALSELELIPPLARAGVILAGDLFAAPDAAKMGATGDVRSVWRALRRSGVRWVAGVAGNHDLFGGDEGLAGLRAEEGIHVLDGDRVHVDGLRIAGVSGITGNKRKPNRRPADAFVAAVRDSLAGRPDLVVLHEGPSGGERQRGNDRLRELLHGKRVTAICGHVHWRHPLAELGAAQVLNADGRVIVLGRAG